MPILSKSLKIRRRFICLSCGDDAVRANEFKNFVHALNEDDYKIFKFPIIRGLKLNTIIAYYKWLSSLKFSDVVVTHTIYGDEHQHPQHILLGITILLLSIRNRFKVVMIGNAKIAFSVMLKRTFSSQFMFTTVIHFPLKIFLFLLFKLLFKSVKRVSGDPDIRKKVIQCYKSQNLDYKIFNENNYVIYEMRWVHEK